MRFAQILNNKAHWIFEAAERPEFAANIILIEVDATVQEGWDWTGESFVSPAVAVVTLDQKMAEVNRKYDSELNALQQKILKVQAMGLSAAGLIAQRPAILVAKKAAMQEVLGI